METKRVYKKSNLQKCTKCKVKQEKSCYKEYVNRKGDISFHRTCDSCKNAVKDKVRKKRESKVKKYKTTRIILDCETKHIVDYVRRIMARGGGIDDIDFFIITHYFMYLYGDTNKNILEMWDGLKDFYNKENHCVELLTCKGCNETKTTNCFYKNDENFTGYKHYCKECFIERYLHRRKVRKYNI